MVHTHARNTLDTAMRRLLAQLELISAIPASSYDSSHGTDDDPGGRRPPGDYGFAVYRDWYLECTTDPEREDCISAAQRELDHLRKGTQADSTTLETHEQLRARMLEETEGWSLADVSQSQWRMSTTIVRRLRVAAGRSGDTGLPAQPENNQGLDLASRAREMKTHGMSLRGIALALGVDKQQVQRFLRKVA